MHACLHEFLPWYGCSKERKRITILIYTQTFYITYMNMNMFNCPGLYKLPCSDICNCILTKSSDMLNKNTLGVKKGEANKKQHD